MSEGRRAPSRIRGGAEALYFARMSARDEPRHPIRVVAERTGLTPDVLRAWQKRYRVVTPGRSEQGQRLYSDEEVERLRLAALAVQAGRTPAQVASLSTEELATLVAEDDRSRIGASEARNGVVGDALAAVEQLDAELLEAILRRALLQTSIARFQDEVAVPLLRTIGDRWAAGSLTPAHEHLATAVLRRVLEWVIASCSPRPDAPRVLVATLPDELHEVGALLAAASAASAGWRISYLGANLPIPEIVSSALQVHADVVAISAVNGERSDQLGEQIRQLREALPADVQLWVGGRAIDQVAELPSTVFYMPELGALRDRLARSLSKPRKRKV